MIDFLTHPDSYKHWRLTVDGNVATLTMDIAEDGGLVEGYELKLNSYDLGVDIELYDAIQRIRFEHPEVGSVLVKSGKERVFCSGANIRMLAGSAHAHKVNFCKFTNETRNSMEDASEYSNQKFICVVNGTAAGGGYELALACDHIMLIDDGATAVSLPEVPLLAVLPGTGGLTRVVDKRKVRRDHADFFCTITEGIRGKRALQWKLVDELVPGSKLNDAAEARAREMADGKEAAKGIEWSALNRTITDGSVRYDHVTIDMDRDKGIAVITVAAPADDVPTDAAAINAQGAAFWPLAFSRELEDAIFHLRQNESTLSTWVLKTTGDADKVAAADKALADNADDWLVRETTLFIKRTMKRLDTSSRSMIALIEPGSCFTGTLLEMALAADRSYMLDGTFEGSNEAEATVRLTNMNFGPCTMGNGLTRLQTRFLEDDNAVTALAKKVGNDMAAEDAEDAGLVTFIPDDIDWEDEVRIAIEERSSFSGDALTGMEANLRFPGPETMETKIFGRLSAWQNWIFQRPNAVGKTGALSAFGTGQQADYDKKRV